MAFDLGKLLNCGAYLSKLTRTVAGDFLIENSINLYDLKTYDDVIKNLQEPPLPFPKLELSDDEFKKISMGQFLKNRHQFFDGDIIVLVHDKKTSAIAKVQDNLIKVNKVL